MTGIDALNFYGGIIGETDGTIAIPRNHTIFYYPPNLEIDYRLYSRTDIDENFVFYTRVG